MGLWKSFYISCKSVFLYFLIKSSFEIFYILFSYVFLCIFVVNNFAKLEGTFISDLVLFFSWTFFVPQMVKNLPAMQETCVQSLAWEDPLEKGMATHSSILVWRILRTKEPGSLQSMVLQTVRHDWATKGSTILSLEKSRLKYTYTHAYTPTVIF